MSKSEAVVIESIEVQELLRFLLYLDILNKLSLLQRKHSKYMYARCLNFPCFINYLAACMHAFCMFYLYVSLGEAALASSGTLELYNQAGNRYILDIIKPDCTLRLLKCTTFFKLLIYVDFLDQFKEEIFGLELQFSKKTTQVSTEPVF